MKSQRKILKQKGITLEELETWIGHDLPTNVGGDEATGSDIRRRLEVFGFDCPLHYDVGVAKTRGYRDIIAPSTMVTTFSLPGYWEPGEPGPQVGESPLSPSFATVGLPAYGTHGVPTNHEVEYFEPVYPGDRIDCTAKLLKVTPKQTRIGHGVFMTIEITYRKQTKEIVSIDEITIFSYTPSEGN